MKKTLSCIFAVMFVLSSFATPQESNIIFIDGKAWSLFTTEPISGVFAKRQVNFNIKLERLHQFLEHQKGLSPSRQHPNEIL